MLVIYKIYNVSRKKRKKEQKITHKKNRRQVSAALWIYNIILFKFCDTYLAGSSFFYIYLFRAMIYTQ